MWLDELNELVGTLKGRIEQHRDMLSKSETATRYALIDPLLTALGWDLQDPGQVRMEYHTGGGFADYAMLSGGSASRPRLVIEAKKLGRPLSEGLSQSITYSNEKGILYSVVTNGRDWAAYDTFKAVPNEDKKIIDFNLMDPTQTIVMKMLWLWRGNFESGSPIVPVAPDRPILQPTATPAPQLVPVESPSNVQRPNRDTPLDEFNPSRRDRPPAALLFPDGINKKITKWFEIQISVVGWLIETGRLTDADCPMMGSRGGHLVVASSADKNGNSFLQPKQVGNLWVEGARDAPNHARVAKLILAARNVDPSNVQVVMGA